MSSEAAPVVVLDANYLALTAIITVGFQFIFFLITAIAKFDKVTDFVRVFVASTALGLIARGTQPTNRRAEATFWFSRW